MNYQIQVLKMGQCQVRGPEVYWMDRWDDWEELFFYLVLVRGGGRTAIINTGPPRKVTQAVLFHTSDDASFATGPSLMVDGGYSTH